MSIDPAARSTQMRPRKGKMDLAELHSGDRMTQREFHEIYERTPAKFKAELVGGIVYVPSPLKRRHGKPHIALGALFWLYTSRTPGVEVADNVTVILHEEGEPQPDLYLRIRPEFGGQSATSKDDYVSGPPELIAELALSSHSIDLHGKREDYQRHGVKEYLVVSLHEEVVHWFDLGANEELSIPADGICRIRQFPGLWVHPAALLADDTDQLMAALEAGLATPEHAEFVKRLEEAKTRAAKPKKKSRRRKKE